MVGGWTCGAQLGRGPVPSSLGILTSVCTTGDLDRLGLSRRPLRSRSTCPVAYLSRSASPSAPTSDAPKRRTQCSDSRRMALQRRSRIYQTKSRVASSSRLGRKAPARGRRDSGSRVPWRGWCRPGGSQHTPQEFRDQLERKEQVTSIRYNETFP